VVLSVYCSTAVWDIRCQSSNQSNRKCGPITTSNNVSFRDRVVNCSESNLTMVIPAAFIATVINSVLECN
jgi:hypothetical protein